jgi:plasmid stability protein
VHSFTASVRLWYGRPVKNITVAIPEEVYRDARIRAAEQGRSVSALVADYLRSLSEEGGEFARLEALQRDVQAEIRHFRAGDAVHDRAVR